MASTLAKAEHRSHPNTHRADLDAIRAGSANLRMDSDRVRIDPNQDDKAEFLAVCEEARIKCGLSKKEMAITARVTESTFNEAWSGKRGNVAIQWLWSQGDGYMATLIELVAERRGLSAENNRAVRAERIGELVRLLVEQP